MRYNLQENGKSIFKRFSLLRGIDLWRCCVALFVRSASSTVYVTLMRWRDGSVVGRWWTLVDEQGNGRRDGTATDWGEEKPDDSFFLPSYRCGPPPPTLTTDRPFGLSILPHNSSPHRAVKHWQCVEDWLNVGGIESEIKEELFIYEIRSIKTFARTIYGNTSFIIEEWSIWLKFRWSQEGLKLFGTICYFTYFKLQSMVSPTHNQICVKMRLLC